MILLNIKAFLSNFNDGRHSLTVWLFLRALALVYFFAFLSLAEQIIGLIGKKGILPACDFLQMVGMNFGNIGFGILPTIFWFNHSDNMLLAICISGSFLALLLFFGVLDLLCLILLWFFYLSLVNVAQDFLSFQWDILLLETGFLAIFIAPWRCFTFSWKSLFSIQPPIAIIWLLRWLLFRLMFESGLVKLASGDPVWRNLTALNYHFFTQPLPTPMSWYAAQLPPWLNEINVFFVFIIELIMPFFIFFGQKARLLAAFAFIGFQIIIAITGNYAFFNLLTIILCIVLLDDKFLLNILTKIASSKTRIIEGFKQLSHLPEIISLPRTQKIIANTIAVFILCVSIGSLENGLAGLLPMPSFFLTLHELTAPYYIANSYGLFAVMTTQRREIIVEGSNDGKQWQEYKFKYKPDDLNKALPIVAPLQPRLDWQMWFAALSEPRNEYWFISFVSRLLQGNNEVLALLANNPFKECPPKYIRGRLYNYQFTNSAEHKLTGNWWKRDFVGECLQPLSLKNR